MERVPNWSNKLVRWSGHMVGLPVVVGKTDCGSLALHALRVMYGEPHPLERELGYSNKKELVRTVKDVDWVGVVSVYAKEVPYKYARTGDFMVEVDGHDRGIPSIGVCIDRRLLVAWYSMHVGWVDRDATIDNLSRDAAHVFRFP